MGNIPRIEPELVLNHKFADTTFEYTERDVQLYALGVGACGGEDPTDPLELPFVYHPESERSVKMLPTFAACYCSSGLIRFLDSVAGLHFDSGLLLHGEHYTEIWKPWPTRARLRSSTRIAGLHDKGKAAVVEVEVINYNTGEKEDALSLNRFTIFLRGAGGFSSASSQRPFSFSDRTKSLVRVATDVKGLGKGLSDERVPDVVYGDQTRGGQALLYRLSGDYNKLHADPKVASEAGFERPILHGLCTLGYAVRAVVRSCCNGEPTRVQSLQGRFLSHVIPGEKLITEMWLDATRTKVTYKTKANGRNILAGTVILAPTRSLL